MAKEKRLIDVNEALKKVKKLQETDPAIIGKKKFTEGYFAGLDESEIILCGIPTVDAVEMPDKELLKAVEILVKQYAHSKRSDYVHNPIAHAFFHTWKQLDESGYGERRENG